MPRYGVFAWSFPDGREAVLCGSRQSDVGYIGYTYSRNHSADSMYQCAGEGRPVTGVSSRSLYAAQERCSCHRRMLRPHVAAGIAQLPQEQPEHHDGKMWKTSFQVGSSAQGRREQARGGSACPCRTLPTCSAARQVSLCPFCSLRKFMPRLPIRRHTCSPEVL